MKEEPRTFMINGQEFTLAKKIKGKGKRVNNIIDISDDEENSENTLNITSSDYNLSVSGLSESDFSFHIDEKEDEKYYEKFELPNDCSVEIRNSNHNTKIVNCCKKSKNYRTKFKIMTGNDRYAVF